MMQEPIPRKGALQAPFAVAKSPPMSQTTKTDNSLSLWMLMLGNFIIGTGILLPAGLLNDFTADFGITASRAGLLLFVGGLVVCIGAPVLASLTSRIERRPLLVVALALYAAGHAAAALAPSFELQVIVRAVTVIGAAVFTPQAASTVGLLVPAEKRAGAIAFIFIGWSAASVAGIPLGTLLSQAFGWRAVYGLMAGLSLVAAISVWLTLKPKLFVTPLSLVAWKETVSSPLLWLVFMVTLFSMSGQFSMFGYIAPILKDGFGASPAMISTMFAVVGVAGVVGNTIASRVVSRLGTDRVIAVALASLCAGFAGFALMWGYFLPAMVAAAFWGLGSFSSNSLQQSRLVALAPHLAAATVALNTSVVYLGQSLGSVAGGRMVDSGQMTATPFVALAFMTVALALSLVAQRLTRPTALAS
jgi:MFS transporter, DHA1 family, inner membrane transport protein